MIPAGLSISGLMTDAGSVVTEFGPLILLVGGLGLGIWGVGFLANMLRKARR